MDTDEGLGAAERGCAAQKVEAFNKPCEAVAVAHLKRHHRPEANHLRSRPIMLRMFGKTGVVHSRNR